jgi:hypothetical protein
MSTQPSHRRTVLVFAKPPLMGLAKTRLARDLGAPAEAARIARFLTLRTLSQVRDPRWLTRLLVTPARNRNHPTLPFRSLHPNFDTRHVQGEGNLGDRLQRGLIGAPLGHVLLVGTDTPAVTRQHIAAAFRALRDHDVVVGPAEDGGFWLFGVSGRHSRQKLFQDVPWSSADTLSRLLARLAPSCQIATLETLRDVDTADDLARLMHDGWPMGLHSR